MKKPHFICTHVLGKRRTMVRELSKKDKYEKVVVTVTLISSGNTSKINNYDIADCIIRKLSKVR